MPENFSIINTGKGKLPRLPFRAIKEAILGIDYTVSLAFVDEKTSTELHEKFKDEKGPANVLSFPLEADSGEIIICAAEAKRQAPKFDVSFKNVIGYFFIHGLLHLKGFDHGSTMVNEEKRFCEKFKIQHPAA